MKHPGLYIYPSIPDLLSTGCGISDGNFLVSILIVMLWITVLLAYSLHCLLLPTCDCPGKFYHPASRNNCPINTNSYESVWRPDLTTNNNNDMSSVCYSRDQLFSYRSTTSTPPSNVLDCIQHHGITAHTPPAPKPSRARRKQRGGVGCRHSIRIVTKHPDTCQPGEFFERDLSRGVNPQQLISIKTVSCRRLDRTQLYFCFMNAQSVKNKATRVLQFILDNDFDIFAITETWLRPGEIDSHIIATITPPGYSFKHVPRPDGYGGVAVIHKSSILLTQTGTVCAKEETTNFEYICLRLTTKSSVDTLCVIYRPPPSDANGFDSDVFLDEFSSFVANLSIWPGRLFMAGDFNYQVDNPACKKSMQFKRLVSALSLKQHVRGATQDRGHTLDLFITRQSDNVTVRPSVVPAGFSDHSAVQLRLTLSKPPLQRKEISYRKLRCIDKCAFKADLLESPFVTSIQQTVNPDDIVASYNSSVTTVLDKHAPLKTRNITLRPNSPWFTDDLQKEKQLKRSWRSRHHQVYNQT